MSRLRKLVKGVAIPAWLLMIYGALDALSTFEWVAQKLYRIWELLSPTVEFMTSPKGTVILVVSGLAWLTIVAFWPEKVKQVAAPASVEVPKGLEPNKALPNLKVVRSRFGVVGIGKDNYKCVLMEVSNELMDGKQVGHAVGIKAHLTYFDEKKGIIAKNCPAYWDTYHQHNEAFIPPGESREVVIAFYLPGGWSSGWRSSNHVILGCEFITIRIIDSNSNSYCK